MEQYTITKNKDAYERDSKFQLYREWIGDRNYPIQEKSSLEDLVLYIDINGIPRDSVTVISECCDGTLRAIPLDDYMFLLM